VGCWSLAMVRADSNRKRRSAPHSKTCGLADSAVRAPWNCEASRSLWWTRFGQKSTKATKQRNESTRATQQKSGAGRAPHSVRAAGPRASPRRAGTDAPYLEGSWTKAISPARTCGRWVWAANRVATQTTEFVLAHGTKRQRKLRSRMAAREHRARREPNFNLRSVRSLWLIHPSCLPTTVL
jgi:hypothetical protein